MTDLCLHLATEVINEKKFIYFSLFYFICPKGRDNNISNKRLLKEVFKKRNQTVLESL